MKRFGLTFTAIITIALVAGAIVAANNLTKRAPTAAEIAREAARLEAAQTWAKIWPWALAGIILVIVAVLGRFIWIGLNYLDRRANEVRAKDGLFPVLRIRGGKDGTVIWHDPNRNPVPTMIQANNGAIDYAAPDHILPDQTRAALAASAVQATSGAQPLRSQFANKLGRGGTTVNIFDEDEHPPMMNTNVPQPVLIDAGHVRRLLDAQGSLPPDARDPGEGEEAI